jgi:erythromycin esterase-like protein
VIVTVEEWIAREAVTFSLDAAGVQAAVDGIVAALGPGMTMLGLGEPTHGAEEFLVLRNRMFERLVEAHGYTAIALESSFTRGRLINRYVRDEIAGAYEDVQERGFSHNFGRSAANREVVEWMRAYNAAHGGRLRFYGFDSPTEMTHADSPRQLLSVALDFLAASGDGEAAERRKRIEELLGEDAAWEHPSSTFDSSKSIGLSAAATSLRIEAENLVLHLRVNRPQLAAADREAYREALHDAEGARIMLDYHAQLAGAAATRFGDLLAIRDLIMADNLRFILESEQARGGKVFVFAHNSHLQRGQATWQWGPNRLQWWPAGSHLDQIIGDAYAVVGTGAVELAPHGVSLPEAGTLEALLAAESSGEARFPPTHRGRHLAEGSRVATRSDSVKNPGYFPFTARSLADFDGLIVLR